MAFFWSFSQKENGGERFDGGEVVGMVGLKWLFLANNFSMREREREGSLLGFFIFFGFRLFNSKNLIDQLKWCQVF